MLSRDHAAGLHPTLDIQHDVITENFGVYSVHTFELYMCTYSEHTQVSYVCTQCTLEISMMFLRV